MLKFLLSRVIALLAGGATNPKQAANGHPGWGPVWRSIKGGLIDMVDEIRAHKYAAFASCLTRKNTQCRSEFRTIFSLGSAFELVPSEAGHPVWTAIYRKEIASAKRSRAALWAVMK